jgi:hypothetical protein
LNDRINEELQKQAEQGNTIKVVVDSLMQLQRMIRNHVGEVNGATLAHWRQSHVETDIILLRLLTHSGRACFMTEWSENHPWREMIQSLRALSSTSNRERFEQRPFELHPKLQRWVDEFVDKEDEFHH